MLINYIRGWTPAVIKWICQVVSNGEGEKFLCLHFECKGSIFGWSIDSSGSQHHLTSILTQVVNTNINFNFFLMEPYLATKALNCIEIIQCIQSLAIARMLERLNMAIPSRTTTRDIISNMHIHTSHSPFYCVGCHSWTLPPGKKSWIKRFAKGVLQ
jgi:hypothetical protein